MWGNIDDGKEPKLNLVWRTNSNNRFSVIPGRCVSPDLLATPTFWSRHVFPTGCVGQKDIYIWQIHRTDLFSPASFPHCAFRCCWFAPLFYTLNKWSHTVQKATDCDCLSSILERNFQPVHGGNPKADQLLLYCITEISCSRWNILNPTECSICRSRAVFICVFHRLFAHSLRLKVCGVEVVAPDKNLLCKTYWRSPELEIWVACCRLPVHIFFMHQQSDLKRVKDCLPSYVKHISPILLACLISAAFYSAQHFFFKKSLWKCSWLFPLVFKCSLLPNMNAGGILHRPQHP